MFSKALHPLGCLLARLHQVCRRRAQESQPVRVFYDTQPHFQRSERSLHLTKVVSRFSPCGDTEAASFPQEPATGKTPWCFTRRGFSTPYPLRRTAPENCITP